MNELQNNEQILQLVVVVIFAVVEDSDVQSKTGMLRETSGHFERNIKLTLGI